MIVLASAPRVSGDESIPLVALSWEGYGESEGCLGVSSLAVRVEDHLARRAFDPSAARRLTVIVDQAPDGRFRALVRVVGANGQALGERWLEGEEKNCGSLDEALILAVALLVDAELGLEPEPEPPPPEPPEPLPPEPEQEPEPPPSTTRNEPPPPPQPWRFRGDATLLAADGVLPEFGFGAELAFVADPPGIFPIRARLAAFLPQSVQLEPFGAIDVATGLAGLGACALSERAGALEVEGCVGADAVLLRAESTGLEGARRTSELYFQGSLAFRVLMDLSPRWFSSFGLNAGVPLNPPEFVYQRNGSVTPVFGPADASLTVGLGFGARVGP